MVPLLVKDFYSNGLFLNLYLLPAMTKLFLVLLCFYSLSALAPPLSAPAVTHGEVDIALFGARKGSSPALIAAAITKACLYAAAGHFKKVLVSGYYITDPIQLSDGIELVGKGFSTGLELPLSARNRVLVRVGNGNAIRHLALSGGRVNRMRDSAALLLMGENCDGITLQDVYLHNSGGDGIYFLNSSDIWLDHVKTDSMGTAAVHLYQCAHTKIMNCDFGGWDANGHGRSCIEWGSNTAHTMHDTQITDCRFLNRHNSTKFVLEAGGYPSTQNENVVIERNYFDLDFHSTGVMSLAVDTLRSDHNVYAHGKTSSSMAYGVECSGSDMHWYQEDFGNTSVQLSSFLLDTCRNVSVTHCRFTPVSSSFFGCVIAIGGTSVGHTVFKGLRFEDNTIHAEKAITDTILNFGCYGGNRATLFGASIKRNKIYAAAATNAFYFAGQYGSDNVFQDNAFYAPAGSYMFRYRVGAFYRTRFIHNVCPPPAVMFHGSVNDNNMPGMRKVD